MIASKQTSISGRNDRAEISCHLRNLARIEKIKLVGFEAAMRDESRTRTRNVDYASRLYSPPQVTTHPVTTPPVTTPPFFYNQPSHLIDPFSGQAMPRTGHGYT